MQRRNTHHDALRLKKEGRREKEKGKRKKEKGKKSSFFQKGNIFLLLFLLVPTAQHSTAQHSREWEC
jgi:hypothetical protein